MTTKHKIGTCWVNYKNDLCYVNIPKCASSSIKYELKKLRFREEMIDIGGVPAFTVIRDPYSRYVSGILEYWERNHVSNDLVSWVRGMKKIKIYDEHTERQIKYLVPFLTDLRWVFVMEDLSKLKMFNINVREYINKKPDYLLDLVRENLPFTVKEILNFYSVDTFLYRTFKKKNEFTT